MYISTEAAFYRYVQHGGPLSVNTWSVGPLKLLLELVPVSLPQCLMEVSVPLSVLFLKLYRASRLLSALVPNRQVLVPVSTPAHRWLAQPGPDLLLLLGTTQYRLLRPVGTQGILLFYPELHSRKEAYLGRSLTRPLSRRLGTYLPTKWLLCPPTRRKGAMFTLSFTRRATGVRKLRIPVLTYVFTCRLLLALMAPFLMLMFSTFTVFTPVTPPLMTLGVKRPTTPLLLEPLLAVRTMFPEVPSRTHPPLPRVLWTTMLAMWLLSLPSSPALK